MKKIVVLIALSMLAACSPKKSAVKSNVSAVPAGSILGGTQCPTGSTNSANNVGSIYDTSMNSYNFENQVKGLLSAAVSPYEVGSISPQGNSSTGVRFSGTVKLDGSGNVLGPQSSVKITVYDSIWFANQSPSNLIEINFAPQRGATIGGQFNLSSGEGTLTLQDQYGQVTFTGRLDAQSFSGTVSYQNSVSVLGGTPASGNLGQFFIQRCALFQ